MSVNDTNSDYSPLDPATWPLPAASGRILGIDVGLHADHSALALAGVWGALMGVVRVKQFALGTPLEMVADEVAKVARENRATIVVDASNNAAFVGTCHA